MLLQTLSNLSPGRPSIGPSSATHLVHYHPDRSHQRPASSHKPPPLHPENSKPCIHLPPLLPSRHLQPHSHNLPSLLRRNDTIIPKPRRTKQRLTLPLNPRLQLGRILGIPLPNRRHNSTQLLRPHNTRTRIRPRPQKPGSIRPPTHPIVTRTATGAKDNSQLGHLGAGNGRHELCAVLGDAAGFGVAPDHEAGDVLQEEQRDGALRAELDEVRAFEAGRAKEDAVVGDYADWLALDVGEACGGFVN